MIDKVLAVLVLYGVSLEESLTYQTILLALKKKNSRLDIVVYDNSPTENDVIIESDNLNIIYEKDYSNSGISKAYNFAANFASGVNKDWLLFLDQDSNIPIDFFDVIDNYIQRFSNEVLFVPVLKKGNMILSPCHFKYMKGSSLKEIQHGLNSVKDRSVFNSGIVINLFAFNSIGGYEERIPLDFSDHSFFARYKKKYSQMVVFPVVIEHELSSFSKDKKSLLRRFKQYCSGVSAYSRIEGGRVGLLFWTSLRAVKLSLKFKTFDFIREFFKIIVVK